MPLETIAVLLAALVVGSTVVGLLWKATTGRSRRLTSGATRIDREDVPLGSLATLLQFSTPVCSPCVPTRAILGSIATEHDGVAHIDLDISSRPGLATELRILQTPTTLVLDGAGAVVARIGGAPRRGDILKALAAVPGFPAPDSLFPLSTTRTAHS